MITVMFVELRVLAVIFFMTLDIHHSHAGIAKLPAPQNVKITSINMGAVLEWKYPKDLMNNVTYTTRYILGKSIKDVCINSKELKCDAGKLPLIFGSYIFQVRAEEQGRFSEWVNASEFKPNRHTTLEPPTVHLVIRNNILDVHVHDPVLRVSTLTKAYSRVSYVIRYWINDSEESVIEKKINKEHEEEDVKLSIKGLQLWSRYCVRAQVLPLGYRNAKSFSKAVCVTNTPVMISCLIAAAILLPLVILTSWTTYKVREFLYPQTELPDRFSKFEATQHATNQKEQLDKISAISEDHLHDGLGAKAINLEDKCCLAPIQEVEDDYKHLVQIKSAPTFYPNHLYPLCLKNKLFTHLNQPDCEGSTDNQSHYYNLTDINLKLKRTDCVF